MTKEVKKETVKKVKVAKKPKVVKVAKTPATDTPAPKKKRAPSAWNKHVSEFYKEKKKADSTYQYKNALKEAKASYKKKPSSN